MVHLTGEGEKLAEAEEKCKVLGRKELRPETRREEVARRGPGTVRWATETEEGTLKENRVWGRR